MEHDEKSLDGWHEQFAGKWFLPILRRLAEFENHPAIMSPEIREALKDDAPELPFRSLWKIAEPTAQHSGLTSDPRKMDARTIGKIIGGKWTYCDNAARSYSYWSQCSPEHAKKWEENFGEGFVAEAIEETRLFKDELTPEFAEIQKEALRLVQGQGVHETVDYYQGFAQGAKNMDEELQRFWKRLMGQMKRSKNKRENDTDKRMMVYTFAFFAGFEIEKEKKDLSWPELHQRFSEFTFAEVLDVKKTRAYWNYLLTLIKRKWPKLQGLRVFEIHKNHGLHVHLLTNRFIDVRVARELAKQAGWGRIHVKRLPTSKAGYLAKYLSKKRPKCLKGWRLWAAFGKDWTWTKVGDVTIESLFSTIYKACKEWLGWKGKKGFFERMRLVNFLYARTIVEGWKEGLGPNDKPFWMCSHEELMDRSFHSDAPF